MWWAVPTLGFMAESVIKASLDSRVFPKLYLDRNTFPDTAVTLSIAIYNAIQHRAIHCAEGTIKSGQ